MISSAIILSVVFYFLVRRFGKINVDGTLSRKLLAVYLLCIIIIKEVLNSFLFVSSVFQQGGLVNYSFDIPYIIFSSSYILMWEIVVVRRMLTLGRSRASIYKEIGLFMGAVILVDSTLYLAHSEKIIKTASSVASIIHYYLLYFHVKLFINFRLNKLEQ